MINVSRETFCGTLMLTNDKRILEDLLMGLRYGNESFFSK